MSLHPRKISVWMSNHDDSHVGTNGDVYVGASMLAFAGGGIAHGLSI